ncbi:citrate synthase family protein [Enhygromyxa salina]|nr:citrate synthase family protein [Enhygromyxa salina]
MSAFISAEQAIARLGVTRATLYAYVSRGMIRSQARPGSRRRAYLAADVERLVQRKRGRQDPSKVAAEALGVHGMPVLRSGLSLIDAGELHYRGRPALTLAREATFEEVAALLWDAPFPADAAPAPTRAAQRKRWAKLPFVAAAQACLAHASADDVGAYHRSPATVRRVGAGILRALAGVATGQAPSRMAISQTLVEGWGVRGRGARAKLEAALVLSADHELNASAFTARCVASTGATPYMAVIAGLAALSGHKHGGHTERVAELVDEAGEPRELLAARLRRGELIPGFGHPLYPDGDPRGAALLELCEGRGAARARAVAEAVEELLGIRPNLDFGLVALGRALGLPRGAPLMLFAVGRCAGWIGHCLEQYEDDQLIRPRARYVGPAPGEVEEAGLR